MLLCSKIDHNYAQASYNYYTFDDKKHANLGDDVSNKQNLPLFDTTSCQGNYSNDNYLLRFFIAQSQFASTNMLRFITWYMEYTGIKYSESAFLAHECFFTELNNTKNLNSKQKFVFAHILLPHKPYFIEDENDNIQLNGGSLESKIDNNQKIINKRFVSVLPNLIKNNPDTIIMILSDHGIREPPKSYDETLKEAVPTHTRFDNFLAVYLPDNIRMNDKITNVNVFRDILRNVDPNIPVLEDEFFYTDDIW